MIRRFWNDIRGSYILLTAGALVPIMGGLALAVDYSQISSQRQATRNALDAAGIATARRIVEGATDDQAKSYAKEFFEANLNKVDPANTTLTVILPNNNTGGGTLKLSATLQYQPIFLPAAAMLIGKSAGSTEVDFTATAEIRLKNTLEVALVLDNSGSMLELGHDSTQVRFELLKDAANQLVDTIALQASQMKQIEKPVQFALVPFAASVNVGSSNKLKTWMDLYGASPIHHENFDWSTIGPTGSAKYVENLGGVRYARGTGWGALKDTVLTRFTLFDKMQRFTGATTYGPVASWEGCVEARPSPYHVNDATPSTGTPATLFVPMFGPDEAGEKWKTSVITTLTSFSAYNNWWNDGTANAGTAIVRQKNMTKYFDVAPKTAPVPAEHTGPNGSCTTKPILPLTEVSTAEGLKTVKDAIDAMAAVGGTNVPEGMAWGWRTVSSGVPFTEGRPEIEKGNDKVVIVLTDGANTYYTPSSLGSSDSAGNKSIYSNYGYAKPWANAYSYGRIFLDTTVSKTDYSNANYTAAMNQHFTKLCSDATFVRPTADGTSTTGKVIVMTVALDLDDKDPTEKAQINALKACASPSRFTKGKFLFWNATGATLDTVFEEIANELSNLRIVG